MTVYVLVVLSIYNEFLAVTVDTYAKDTACEQARAAIEKYQPLYVACHVQQVR